MTARSPIRRQLEQLLAEARARLALHDGQPGDVGRDELDVMLAAEARESAAVDRYRLAREVRAIEEAIARVEAGAWGKCACGEPIGAGRLAAIPWAETCIDCARKAERGW